MSAQYDATKVGQQAETLGGVHTAAGLAKLYANNPPGIGVPAGSTAYASDLGPAMFDGTTWINAAGALALSTSASAATANTALINAALARGGQVSITAPGTYYVTSSQSVSFNGNTYALCLKIPSNTRFVLGAGVVLKIADGLTNPVLIQNTNALGAGDVNISIEGGQWDGNKANSTRSDGTAMCSFMIWFSNVKYLDLRRMWWSNSITYHSFISSVTTFRIENIRIYDTTPAINGDGVHIHGNCYDGVIRAISGNVGDDLIPLLTHDTAHSYTSVLDSGPISDILIDGVVGDETQGAWHLVNLVDFAAYPMTNVTVRNVSGYYTDGGVRLAGTSGVKRGIVIDNVTASPLAGSNPIYGQVSLESGGDSVTISNVTRYYNDNVETGTKLPAINVTGGTWNYVKINNFYVGDLTAAGAGIGFYKVQSTAVASNSELTNVSAGSVVHSDALIWNAGVMGSIKVSNCDTIRIHQLLFTANTIQNGLFVSNYRGNNNNNAAILTSGAFTLPQITLNGVLLDGTQGGSSGCIRIGGTTGTVLIQMQGCVFSNGGSANLTRAGSETIRVQSIDTPVPSTALTPARGDMILDSANSNDPYRYSGSAWVAL